MVQDGFLIDSKEWPLRYNILFEMKENVSPSDSGNLFSITVTLGYLKDVLRIQLICLTPKDDLEENGIIYVYYRLAFT